MRDRAVTTIEDVGASPSGAKIQKAWLDLEMIQCGYCQSGQIMWSQFTAQDVAELRKQTAQ